MGLMRNGRLLRQDEWAKGRKLVHDWRGGGDGIYGTYGTYGTRRLSVPCITWGLIAYASRRLPTRPNADTLLYHSYLGTPILCPGGIVMARVCGHFETETHGLNSRAGYTKPD